MSSVAYAQVRVREPLGERILGDEVSIGGTDADVVVPGVDPGPALAIGRHKGVWVLEPRGKAARVNGRPLTSSRDLRKGDVVALGEAQIAVTDMSRTLLRIEIHHLVGNATVAPAAALATVVIGEDEDQDVEIQPLATLRLVPLTTAARVAHSPTGRASAL